MDEVASSFGKDLKTLSHALGNMDIALKKNAVALATTLGHDINLFDSLAAWSVESPFTIPSGGQIWW